MEDEPEKMSFADKIKRMEIVSKSASNNSNSVAQADIGYKPKPLPKPKSLSRPTAQNTPNLQVSEFSNLDNINTVNRRHSALETPVAEPVKGFGYRLSQPLAPHQEPTAHHETERKEQLMEPFKPHSDENNDKSIPNTTTSSATVPIETGAEVLPKESQELIDSRIDFLMLGKTGNGKSSLGNSIVGYNAFEIAGTSTSKIKEVIGAVCQFNERIIKVIDGPGLCETDWANYETTNSLINALSYAVTINPSGYHAILLVVKFGNQFGKEDLDTINYLKTIFGKKCVHKYCILVMTFGDLFQEKITFVQWLKEQTGVLADIIKECNGRVILFDNRTNNGEKKLKQMTSLMEMVDKLRFSNSRYTNEQFELAESERDILILSSIKPVGPNCG